MQKDFLIVGQGVAGSFLAWNLLKRGEDIVIVDEHHSDCSSFAAAGMINPVTGQRLVLSSRCEELLPYAKEVYLELEAQFGEKFFEAKQIIRLFKDDKELQEWERKRIVTHLKKYYGQKQPPGTYGNVLNDVKSSFIIEQGGYCRTGDLMRCFTQYFQERQCLIDGRFDFDELKVSKDHVEWRGDTFRFVVFAEGFQAKDNPYFSWLPYNLAKGEILTLVNEGDALPDAVISCGKWCIPIEEGKYTVGSTYTWEKFDCQTTEAGKQEILSAIRKFVKVPFNVAEHAAGVRPIVKDRKPAIGLHPEHERVAIFNGLASKGLLWGPFYSKQMADFLIDGQPLEDDVNIRRFFKKHYYSAKD